MDLLNCVRRVFTGVCGSRNLVAALGVALAAGTLAGSAASSPRSEVPLANLLEIVVLRHSIVAIDARDGGETRAPLELGETVRWTGTRGRIGVALTNRRILAVAKNAAAWQSTRYLLDESHPRRAQLGDRVALLTTNKRVIGFDGGSGNLIETLLGPRESVATTAVGENIAVAVTQRRALGLSPFAGGFFPIRLELDEALRSVRARADFATVMTSHRILVFRAGTGSWEERVLNLDDAR